MFHGLSEAADRMGISFQHTYAYEGDSDLLMLWGPGAPNRFPAINGQLARKKPVVTWDLAYWNRDKKVRCSINGAHCPKWIMKKDWPSSRFDEDKVEVSDVWNKNGPIVVAGLGQKARVQYGADVIDRWEADMVAGCLDRWDRRVLYRQKNGTGPNPPFGAGKAPNAQIERVLEGASLVITWHSNVAVDALRLGIPVICRDGAAAAICPSELPDHVFPSPVEAPVRDRFLRNLAWFQWAPSEGRQFWSFLKELLS